MWDRREVVSITLSYLNQSNPDFFPINCIIFTYVASNIRWGKGIGGSREGNSNGSGKLHLGSVLIERGELCFFVVVGDLRSYCLKIMMEIVVAVVVEGERYL